MSQNSDYGPRPSITTVGTQQYAQLPLCLDSSGHRFEADMIRAETAVCRRCGLIRKQVVRS
jgi:hypothetical protein